MTTPAEHVENQFNNATTYASNGVSAMEEAVNDLMAAAEFTNPTVDVEYAPVEEPTTLAAATRPGALDTIEAEFNWDKDSVIADNKPDALVLAAPSITIDDFTDEAPEVDTSDEPTLTFPSVPTVTLDTIPEVTTPDEVTVPDAPTLETVDLPTLLTLSTPTFAGVDLDATYLTQVKDVPTLDLVAPTPYTYTPGEEYSSALLTALKTGLASRLAGGTGLDPAVEAAIWDRGRDREIAALQENIDAVEATSEALGYNLPADVLASGVRRAQSLYFERSGDLSREVSIKQADLEQQNLRDAVQQGIALEGQLINYSYQLERITFENAQKVADNAIQVYNAQVENFKAVVDAHRLMVSVYEQIIRGQLAKVEVYKGELEAERLKADANKTLIEQYKAQIEAGLASVKVFEAQVNASKARMELEQTKIQASAERIRGFVARINGETAKVELYKAQVSAEGEKARAWETTIRGRLGAVQAFEAKARAFSAKANAQESKARAELARFEGLVKAKEAEWRSWTAIIEGERARLAAVGQKADSLLTGYKIDAEIVSSQVAQDTKRWETQIKEYEASKNYVLNGQKMNADLFLASKELHTKSLSTIAQVWAQYTASALSMIRTSAGVSASASNSVSYSYTNDTSSSPSPVTAV
jgi:hypothetical protein